MTPHFGTLAEPNSFSVAEKLILVAAMATSICSFWLRFRKVLAIILGAKPGPGFKLSPLAPRLRDLIWEVFCQATVVRQGPLDR